MKFMLQVNAESDNMADAIAEAKKMAGFASAKFVTIMDEKFFNNGVVYHDGRVVLMTEPKIPKDEPA